MKWLFGSMIGLLCLMQYQIWFGQSGYFARKALTAQKDDQLARAAQLEQRNARITAEVIAFKSDPAAFESRARSELGLIKPGEVFYLIPDAED